MFNMDAETFCWVRIGHFNKNIWDKLESHILKYKNIDLFLKLYTSTKSKVYQSIKYKS